jgi:hypothetical protein
MLAGTGSGSSADRAWSGREPSKCPRASGSLLVDFLPQQPRLQRWLPAPRQTSACSLLKMTRTRSIRSVTCYSYEEEWPFWSKLQRIAAGE